MIPNHEGACEQTGFVGFNRGRSTPRHPGSSRVVHQARYGVLLPHFSLTNGAATFCTYPVAMNLGHMRMASMRALLSISLVATIGGSLFGLAPVAQADESSMVGSVAIPGGASGVAVVGNVVAVTSSAPPSVSIIDAATLTVRSTTALPLVPTEVLLSPAGTVAYVLANDPSAGINESAQYGIYAVDVATGALLRSANGKTCGGSTTLSDLAISPNGSRLNVVARCGSNVEIWAIDPTTLAVGDTALLLYGFLSGLGNPIGSLASFNDRTLTMAYVQVFKCPDMDGCPQPDVIVSVSGESATAVNSGPVQTGMALVRDPADDTVLALTSASRWMEFNRLPALQSLVRFDPTTGAQLGSIPGLGSNVVNLQLDSSKRLLYGIRSSGKSMVVVDLAAGSVLGELRVNAAAGFAVGNGRVYVAQGSGLGVVDPSKTLAPAVAQSVKVKIRPAGKGKVQATITWKAPAARGSTAVTGYRVEAISQNPASDQQGTDKNEGLRSQQSCSTRKTTCVVTLKRVATDDDLFPAMYTVAVTAINAVGPGAANEVSVQAR